MPELLNGGLPIATQDDYVQALQLGPAARTASVTLNVIGAAAVLVQCWRYVDTQLVKSELELVERTIPGQSIGVTFGRCAGIRVRSATAGVPSTVTGELVYFGDVALGPGSVTGATFDANGGVV